MKKEEVKVHSSQNLYISFVSKTSDLTELSHLNEIGSKGLLLPLELNWSKWYSIHLYLTLHYEYVNLWGELARLNFQFLFEMI